MTPRPQRSHRCPTRKQQVPIKRRVLSTKARRAMALLRAATRDWPAATTRLYDFRPPNGLLKIFRGAFLLRENRHEWRLRGSVDLSWLPSPNLRFHGVVTRGKGMPQHGDDRTVRLPGSQPARAIVTGVSWGAHARVDGAIQGVLHLGRARMVRAIRLHVPNFHDYNGARVRFKTGGGGYLRLSLRHDDWRIELDQTLDTNRIVELLRTQGGFGVGHVGLVTQASGRRFTFADADDLVTCLHFFLSFARGFWCGPLIIEGLGRRERPLWTRWLSHLLATDWRGVASWFPVNDASGAGAAFTGFRDLWGEPAWRNQLRQVVHWYISANVNAAAMEGSLILAHAALERLAWTHLVVIGGQSPQMFDKKRTSAQRIEELLLALDIPVSLPSTETQDLSTWAASRGREINSGPEIISEVRNMIVHPKRQAVLMQGARQVRIEAVHLALWYLDVALLALCRYNGRYVNRLHPGPTVLDATMTVPWAANLSMDVTRAGRPGGRWR